MKTSPCPEESEQLWSGERTKATHVFVMHLQWPGDGLEEKSLQISYPRDKVRRARDRPAVTTRMDM
jgi:hypothetical protein